MALKFLPSRIFNGETVRAIAAIFIISIFLSIFAFIIWNALVVVNDLISGPYLYEVTAGDSHSGISVSEGLPWNECLQELETQLDEIRTRNKLRARDQGPEAVLDVHLTCRRIPK